MVPLFKLVIFRRRSRPELPLINGSFGDKVSNSKQVVMTYLPKFGNQKSRTLLLLFNPPPPPPPLHSRRRKLPIRSRGLIGHFQLDPAGSLDAEHLDQGLGKRKTAADRSCTALCTEIYEPFIRTE